jgi:hypothetical protein
VPPELPSTRWWVLELWGHVVPPELPYASRWALELPPKLPQAMRRAPTPRGHVAPPNPP